MSRLSRISCRVVVITYSSVNQVMKQVDHMTRSDITQHKCKLFEDEIASITYNSGGTYTLGALLEAQEVFRYARPSAKKAVFLITDGYSNGGDPRPEAEKLKEIGVEFFTFGIRNGNVKELYDMASDPREEHSFIVDSFEEFEALARRALHKDLGGSVYLVQESSQCDAMCEEGEACCDVSASCSCGAHNGFYSCICPPGHYGRGLRGDCHSKLLSLSWLSLSLLLSRMSGRHLQSQSRPRRHQVVPAVSGQSRHLPARQLVPPAVQVRGGTPGHRRGLHSHGLSSTAPT